MKDVTERNTVIELFWYIAGSIPHYIFIIHFFIYIGCACCENYSRYRYFSEARIHRAACHQDEADYVDDIAEVEHHADADERSLFTNSCGDELGSRLSLFAVYIRYIVIV